MNENEIAIKLAKIISTVFEGKISVGEDFGMHNNQDWSSLKHIELIVMIEEEFDIMFEPELIPELTSQKKLLETLTKLLK